MNIRYSGSLGRTSKESMMVNRCSLGKLVANRLDNKLHDNLVKLIPVAFKWFTNYLS